MVLAFNLVGFYTLIVGFAGLFSRSVAAPVAYAVMALGGLAMYMAFSLSRARPLEPLFAALALAVMAVLASISGARAWFVLLTFGAAAFHFAAAAEATYLRRHREGETPRAFLW